MIRKELNKQLTNLQYKIIDLYTNPDLPKDGFLKLRKAMLLIKEVSTELRSKDEKGT